MNIDEIPEIKRTFLPGKAPEIVTEGDFQGRYFVDLNAHGRKVEGRNFSASVFDNAYMRKAEFKDCNFTGCTFIDSNIKSADFSQCDFKYTRFKNTLLDVAEIISVLPSEPNLRKDCLQSLRANALEVGDHESLRTLVLQEVEATKEHLWRAMWSHDTYYRKKYPGAWHKLRAAWQFAGIKISGFVWGHGEKPWQILMSGTVLLIILTLINFWAVLPNNSWIETHQSLKIVQYSITLFLGLDPDPMFRGFTFVDYAISVMRYIYVGLYISVLYKIISFR